MDLMRILKGRGQGHGHNTKRDGGQQRQTDTNRQGASDHEGSGKDEEPDG